ncbi:hypothetical protein GCM10023085_13660 [Actinomadura viridis]
MITGGYTISDMRARYRIGFIPALKDGIPVSAPEAGRRRAAPPGGGDGGAEAAGDRRAARGGERSRGGPEL